MADVSGAKALIAAEKYREAGKALARLLQERERKRREIEHRAALRNQEPREDPDGEPGLDVMV